MAQRPSLPPAKTPSSSASISSAHCNNILRNFRQEDVVFALMTQLREKESELTIIAQQREVSLRQQTITEQSNQQLKSKIDIHNKAVAEKDTKITLLERKLAQQKKGNGLALAEANLKHITETNDECKRILQERDDELTQLKPIMKNMKSKIGEYEKSIKANADYQGGYALGCPLGRVMISKIAVEVAEQHGCQVIGHGCTGKGNDQVRFEGYITTLNPKLLTIAPVREWGMGREEEIRYAEEHGIPVKQKKDTPYSYDENMWSNTAEGGEIEDPELVPRFDKILLWCKTPEAAPDKSVEVVIGFTKGVPTSLDGSPDKLSNIIKELNRVGGEHACGVFPLIEDRIVGLKVRGVYENPAATILIEAHRKLEMLVSTREENELKAMMDHKWSYLVYGAKWFEPTMSHIRAYINDQNEKVTGTVRVKLYKGNVSVVSLKSDNSLFDANLATFERNASFNQNASPGFIELYNLAQKTAHGAFKHAITERL